MDTQKLDHDEFLRLLLRNEREILRYVMAIVPSASDAQEILQETAIALWKRIDGYDRSQPFAPWACRFAANKAKEHLRKVGRWKGFLDDEVASMLLARREELAVDLDRRLEPLRDCLSALPARNRRLIQQYYFDQASVDDIADQLGRSKAALYKSLQRIRVSLMQCVNGKLATGEAAS
ncbi:MAG: sigma-70 family RNA polymerase sigma factor [Planctomycetota bacterium]